MFFFYEQLLEVVSLATKSSTPIVHLGIGKDIDMMRTLTSIHVVRDITSKGIEALNASLTNNPHSPNSFEVVVK